MKKKKELEKINLLKKENKEMKTKLDEISV